MKRRRPHHHWTTTELAVAALAVIVIADLVGAVLVALIAGRPPVVMGDVAKVGVGALAGVLLRPAFRDSNDGQQGKSQ